MPGAVELSVPDFENLLGVFAVEIVGIIQGFKPQVQLKKFTNESHARLEE